MRESISLCCFENDIFSLFFKSKIQMLMCGVEDHIYKVKIKEASTIDDTTYWSWWDNKDKDFNFTCKNKLGVAICFPYGYKCEEEAGNGKLLPVNIEVLEANFKGNSV